MTGWLTERQVSADWLAEVRVAGPESGYQIQELMQSETRTQGPREELVPENIFLLAAFGKKRVGHSAVFWG